MNRWPRLLATGLGCLVLSLALVLPTPQGQGPRAAPATSTPLYVDGDAAGSKDGTSWDDAFTDLQDALNAAAAAGGGEIWVAAETYKPSVEHGGSGARYRSFQLQNGVALYGGFDPSAGATGFEDRDPVAHETILSGDIGTIGNPSDNSYHVFFHPVGTALDSTAILDGFTITGGKADGTYPHDRGGGMYNSGSSPTLANCTFAGNSANSGGGMYSGDGSPTLANCTFTGNSAAYGGGMYNHLSSSTLTNCTFSGNSAGENGGGMLTVGNVASPPTLANCTFTGNSAAGLGGGMLNGTYSSPALTDCTFAGNSAGEYGGGMYNIEESSPTVVNGIFWGNESLHGAGMANLALSLPVLTNCTFSRNAADADGGGIYNDGLSVAILTNCILWMNSAPFRSEIQNTLTGHAYLRHTDIQGGCTAIPRNDCGPEGSNLDANPQFVDPANGDLHLGQDSPCIDAGDNGALNLPPFDFEGHPRIVDGDGDGTATVDMGADEWVRFHILLPLVLRAY